MLKTDSTKLRHGSPPPPQVFSGPLMPCVQENFPSSSQAPSLSLSSSPPTFPRPPTSLVLAGLGAAFFYPSGSPGRGSALETPLSQHHILAFLGMVHGDSPQAFRDEIADFCGSLSLSCSPWTFRNFFRQKQTTFIVLSSLGQKVGFQWTFAMCGGRSQEQKSPVMAPLLCARL